MSNNRKEEILLATLELASEKGLGSVSLNMIADKVGIRKPSLYNHFSSKEELVEALYQFLREQAKKKSVSQMVDYSSFFAGKTALEILQQTVGGYLKINQQGPMLMFYKVIYSERAITPMAAKIMKEETDKMILATKQMFYAMEIHKILHFQNPEMSALSFAMTVHGLMDYMLDQCNGDVPTAEPSPALLNDYLEWFCKENAVDKESEIEKGKGI